MDDDFASQLNLDGAIAALIDTLTFDFGPDAQSHVAALRKQALDELRQEPRFQSIAGGVYRAGIALRRERMDVAAKLQSNGIKEHANELDARMWHGRILDLFTAELQPREKLLEVHWWRLVTTLRTRTYHELKAGCRMSVETNDAMFERNFDSDATRRAAEAAEHERLNPPPPQYGRNLDFPNGGRPGR